MFKRTENNGRTPRAWRDTHLVTGELVEMLAVLVAPALLLSGLSLFFG